VHDAFISHASEDKDSFVRPLVSCLQQLTVNVWYDEYEVKPGDSLRESIERGLQHSRFGIVVLSESFFAKEWTRREYNALVALEVANRGRVLPVWLNVDRDRVLDYSASLADIRAVVASGNDNDKPLVAALQLLEVINPTAFRQIELTAQRREVSGSLPLAAGVLLNLPRSPIRHKMLDGKLIDRIRVVWAASSEHSKLSLEQTITNFQRDENPEDEIRAWESIIAAYLQLLPYFASTKRRRGALYGALISLSVGFDPEKVRHRFPLDRNEFNLIRSVFPGPFSDEQWKQIRNAASTRPFEMVFRIQDAPSDDVVALNDGTHVMIFRDIH
jgi:hypothetical protein